ncbi:hypothetical protein [Cupriavidus sp. PET2-C1]
MTAASQILRFFVYLSIFAGLLMLRDGLVPHSYDEPVLFFLTVGAAATLYMLYYIVSEGHWAEIAGSIVISLVLAVAAALFPPLGILVVLWVLFNIAKTLASIVQIIPLAIASVLLYVLLFPAPVLRAVGLQGFLGQPVLIAYAAFSILYAAKAARYPMKLGLFKLSVMLLSVPLLALLIASIRSGLQNLFKQSLTSTSRTIQMPQTVQAHIRAGASVDAYTRAVSKTITETAISTTVGTGGVMIGVGAELVTGNKPSERGDHDNAS